MPHRMEVVDQELSFGEEFGFASHAVWPESASKIVDDPFGGGLPSSDQSGEDVIPAFASWYAVEAVGNAMGAPGHHNTPGQPSLAILRIKLGAFGPSFTANFILRIVFQFWISWPLSDLPQSVAAAGLKFKTVEFNAIKLLCSMWTYLHPRFLKITVRDSRWFGSLC